MITTVFSVERAMLHPQWERERVVLYSNRAIESIALAGAKLSRFRLGRLRRSKTPRILLDDLLAHGYTETFVDPALMGSMGLDRA